MSNNSLIEISRLKLDPTNARVHKTRNLDAIKASLKEFGQQKPIVVDRGLRVLAGNGTLMAAKELGWTTIEVRHSDLTGDAAMAFALADNRTSELAEWDMPVVAFQLQSLMDVGFDVASIGFDHGWDKEEEKAEKKEKEVSEKPRELLIVIPCANEEMQKELFNELREKGYPCKIM